MNIKKIILEELNDFDWVGDVMPTEPEVGMEFTLHGEVCTVKHIDSTEDGKFIGVIFTNSSGSHRLGSYWWKHHVSSGDIGMVNESNDFEWMEDLNEFTLGQLYDSGELQVGDKIRVVGKTENGETMGSVEIDAIFTVEEVGSNFPSTLVNTDEETKRALGCDPEVSNNFSLVDEDRKLVVISHTHP